MFGCIFFWGYNVNDAAVAVFFMAAGMAGGGRGGGVAARRILADGAAGRGF